METCILSSSHYTICKPHPTHPGYSASSRKVGNNPSLPQASGIILMQRSQPVPIVKAKQIVDKIDSYKEYELKKNLYDPIKSSPPNDFMLKLHERMQLYGKMDTAGMKEGRRERA